MASDDLVQRVARAIYEATDGYVSGVPWNDDVFRPGTMRRERYEREARAAIAVVDVATRRSERAAVSAGGEAPRPACSALLFDGPFDSEGHRCGKPEADEIHDPLGPPGRHVYDGVAPMPDPTDLLALADLLDGVTDEADFLDVAHAVADDLRAAAAAAGGALEPEPLDLSEQDPFGAGWVISDEFWAASGAQEPTGEGEQR